MHKDILVIDDNSPDGTGKKLLKLKDSGQITGSKVLFTGGTIGGFTIDADEIKSTNVLIKLLIWQSLNSNGVI